MIGERWRNHIKEDRFIFLLLFLLAAFGIYLALCKNVPYRQATMATWTILYLITGYGIFWKKKLNCIFCFGFYCLSLFFFLIAATSFLITYPNKTSMPSTNILYSSKRY